MTSSTTLFFDVALMFQAIDSFMSEYFHVAPGHLDFNPPNCDLRKSLSVWWFHQL